MGDAGMGFKRNRASILALAIILAMTFVSCSNTTVSEESGQGTAVSEKISRLELGSINDTKVVIISGHVAADILAKEDDYTSKLSLFDYASKFKSETPLDLEERKAAYSEAVLDFTDEQVKLLSKTVSSVDALFEGKNINIPDEVSIIITNGDIESNAAYTRGTSIIFPPRMLSSMNEDGMLDLFLHELFHVYSRYNKDKREAIYSIMGYKKCDELVMPDSLKDLTIANPDAPDNNYYINCIYEEKEISFIPIIYSKEAYDLRTNESFFRYLNDDMLAVDISGSIATPITVDGELLIVKKNELQNFYEQIGRNTGYTYHPEETMADNFVLLIRNKTVADKWVLDGLAEIIYE